MAQTIETMVYFNERSISGMTLFASNKINLPHESLLACVEWNLNTNFIAFGGSQGLLKIVKFADQALSKYSGKQMHNLQVNQTMEGHTGVVNTLTWNEVHQKLTSSDANGLITVWNLKDEAWYEEMINNRNKSCIVGMSWSSDGNKIAIAYQDGQVIVGTSEGNRLWSKELEITLSHVEWSPNGEHLLFGIQDGEVHLYDANGNFLNKVNIAAIENVELETALEKPEGLRKKEQIIALRWWHPTQKSRIDHTPFMPTESTYKPRLTKPPSVEFLIPIHLEEVKQPQLVIAYSNGSMQIMTSEADNNPIIVNFDRYNMTTARWSPNGAFIAVGGYKPDAHPMERLCVQVVSAHGTKLASVNLPGRNMGGLSWDPNGIRLAVAVDGAIILTSIRPYYKWGYCGETVIFSYERPEKKEFRVVFFELKREEPFVKTVHNLLHIASSEKYCVVVSRTKGDKDDGRYYLQLCNSIGTPVDYKYVDLEPRCIGMNNRVAVIVGFDSYILWQFNQPKRSTMAGPLLKSKGSNEIQVVENNFEYTGRKKKPHDGMAAVCLGDDFFILVTEDGDAYLIGLDRTVRQKFNLPSGISHMELNCTYKRLATLDKGNTLQFFDIKDKSVDKVKYMPMEPKTVGGKIVPPPPMDRKDVWTFKWDYDREDSIAFNEKGKMTVMSGADLEEGIANMGFISQFKDLTVRTIAIDRYLLTPDKPKKSFVTDIEIKILRDAKQFLLGHHDSLERGAVEYIEKIAHPKLWEILAETALRRLDLEKAEYAFIKLEDYAGLMFIKRVKLVKDINIRRAECDAFVGRLEDAEKGFRHCDRGDLAINMYIMNDEWGKALNLMNRGQGGPGTDLVKKEAWEQVGDQLAEKQKWREAADYYEKAKCPQKLMQCFLKLDDWDALTRLSKTIVENESLLSELAFTFGSAGLCDESVDCYIRCGKVKEALDICIQLNQWAKAEVIARENNLENIDGLLEKHMPQIRGSNERSMAAVQLYRRAGKFLEAAKIVFNIALAEKAKLSECNRMKKLYVMGAMLIEDYLTTRKKKLAEEKGLSPNDPSIILTTKLLQDDGVTIEQSRMIDNAWRGATAYHFYMMAHRQIYKGDVDKAMKTAYSLIDYDDVIEPIDIYSLLAMASVNNRQFGICSRAFMKLERIESDSQQMFKDLALNIFKTYPPTDTKPQTMQCFDCHKMIPDYSQFCPECETKFPICVATGQPLMELQFWLCPFCHQRAYEQHMINARYCPLCHYGLV